MYPAFHPSTAASHTARVAPQQLLVVVAPGSSTPHNTLHIRQTTTCYLHSPCHILTYSRSLPPLLLSWDVPASSPQQLLFTELSPRYPRRHMGGLSRRGKRVKFVQHTRLSSRHFSSSGAQQGSRDALRIAHGRRRRRSYRDITEDRRAHAHAHAHGPYPAQLHTHTEIPRRIGVSRLGSYGEVHPMQRQVDRSGETYIDARVGHSAWAKKLLLRGARSEGSTLDVVVGEVGEGMGEAEGRAASGEKARARARVRALRES